MEMKKIGKKREFLIKWKGWDREEDLTWETEDNLAGSKDLLKAFLAKKEKSVEEKSSPAAKSRRGGKSSMTYIEEDLASHPEVVNIDDSDSESDVTTKSK